MKQKAMSAGKGSRRKEKGRNRKGGGGGHTRIRIFWSTLIDRNISSRDPGLDENVERLNFPETVDIMMERTTMSRTDRSHNGS